MTIGNRYLVFGAGLQGVAIAYDLLKNPTTELVTIVDRSAKRVDEALRRLPMGWTRGETFDIGGNGDLVGLLRGNHCVIGAASYEVHLALTKAALAADAHYCDLGCNNDVVAEQVVLHDEALRLGLRVMPDCGVAPGAVCVLARLAIDRVPDAAVVKLRVGGLPQQPTGPLQYALAYSARGLVSNYVAPVEILSNGTQKMVPALVGPREDQFFPAPIGRLEALWTSGGSSTLTKTYAGRIKYLDYKTLRWPGHWETINMMRNLGLFVEDRTIDVGGVKITPRDFTERLLDETLPRDQPDLLVLRVVAKNLYGDGVQFDLVDRADPYTGFSAMQRTTGFAASIIAQMLVSGEVHPYGVLRHEQVVPAEQFLKEWRKRGINVTETKLTS